jgi:hypothetical protein
MQTALFLPGGGGRKIDTLFLDSYFQQQPRRLRPFQTAQAA